MSRVAVAATVASKFTKQVPKLNYIQFLGTGSAIPQPGKCNVSSCVFTLSNGKSFMVDCGEATQHQAMRSNSVKIRSIEAILITHLHGDHFYGIFGLLATLGTSGKEGEVYVVGPTGIKKAVEAIIGASESEESTYQIKFIEIDTKSLTHLENLHATKTNGVLSISPETTDLSAYSHSVPATHLDAVSEALGITVKAIPIAHRVPTVGYIFEEFDKPGALDAPKAKLFGASGTQLGLLKDGIDVQLACGTVVYAKDVRFPPTKGKKFCLLQDTYDASAAWHELLDCDVMIHEATYDATLTDKAVSHGHSTAAMASEFAFRLRAKELILTHFSARYRKPKLEQFRDEKVHPPQMKFRFQSLIADDKPSAEPENDQVSMTDAESVVDIPNKRAKNSHQCDSCDLGDSVEKERTLTLYDLLQEAIQTSTKLLDNPSTEEGYLKNWMIHKPLLESGQNRDFSMGCHVAYDFKTFEFTKRGEMEEKEFADLHDTNFY